MVGRVLEDERMWEHARSYRQERRRTLLRMSIIKFFHGVQRREMGVRTSNRKELHVCIIVIIRTSDLERAQVPHGYYDTSWCKLRLQILIYNNLMICLCTNQSSDSGNQGFSIVAGQQISLFLRGMNWMNTQWRDGSLGTWQDWRARTILQN